jgi:tetratricopeptide (TPR) repeat protein
MRFPQYKVSLLAAVVLLLLVAVAYRDAPKNVFHFDDVPNIVRHPPIQITELTPDNLANAGRNAFLPSRPLPSVTYAFDWWRGEGSARPFQYTNFVIHATTTIAVFVLLLLVLGRLEKPRWVIVVAAFFGAAIWACHPVQVQGVTYIVQRMASLSALFTILTVILYIIGRGTAKSWRRWVFFGAAVACWTMGLISKETAAIAPFLLLLAEYGVVRHGQALIRSRLDWALLSLPVVIALLIVMDIAGGAGPISDAFLPGFERRDFTLVERLLTQPRVIAFHFSQLVWPMPGRFSLEHEFALSTGLITPASTFAAILAVIAWCALGVRALFQPRWRIMGFLLLWVPATLVIESSFIALEIVFEHRMYLPSVALAGIVALGIASALSRSARLRTVMLGGSTVIVCLLVASTSARVPDWRSSVSLAQATVQTSPNSARAWATLANAYKESGEGWDKIRPPMMKALLLDSGQTLALQLQAFWLLERGELEEAEEVLSRFGPGAQRDHRFLNTLGMLRLEQRNFEEAITHFEQALRINVSVPEVRYNLALSYELWGKCAEAHKKWLDYLRADTNQPRRKAVQARLLRNFETAGGRCYGWERS